MVGNLNLVIRKRLKMNFQIIRIRKYAFFLFALMCTNKCTERIGEWGSGLKVRVVQSGILARVRKQVW